jgi:hypothetical protein
MYKIPLHIIEGLLNSLEQSNLVLAASINDKNCADVTRVMTENLKQIDLIKTNYTFCYEHKG